MVSSDIDTQGERVPIGAAEVTLTPVSRTKTNPSPTDSENGHKDVFILTLLDQLAALRKRKGRKV